MPCHYRRRQECPQQRGHLRGHTPCGIAVEVQNIRLREMSQAGPESEVWVTYAIQWCGSRDIVFSSLSPFVFFIDPATDRSCSFHLK